MRILSNKYFIVSLKIVATISALISIAFGLLLLFPLTMNYSVRANFSFMFLSLFFIISGGAYIYNTYYNPQLSRNNCIRIALIGIISLMLSIAVFPYNIFTIPDRSQQESLEEQRVEKQLKQEEESYKNFEKMLERNPNSIKRQDIKGIL